MKDHAEPELPSPSCRAENFDFVFFQSYGLDFTKDDFGNSYSLNKSFSNRNFLNF